MSNGTTEARTAARWWTDQLLGHPLQEQVEIFRTVLEANILAESINHWSWQRAVESGDPQWGEILRVVAYGYGPEPIFDDALEAAGIKNHEPPLELLPKAIMWINPGQLRVSPGDDDVTEEVKLIAL